MPNGSLFRRSDEDYVVRVRRLGAAVVVLAGLIMLVRVPGNADLGGQTTFRNVEPDDRMTLESLAENQPRLSMIGAPLTRFGPAVPIEEPEANSGDGSAALPDPVHQSGFVERPLERLVLASAEQMPTIRGGLGAYYIHIEYPPSAIEAGIEGRLVLQFVVEEDGTTTDVSVYSSLHPLCDSAAVRALRKTVFLPGNQGGTPVAVRMHLPVRFQLIN